MFLRRFLRRPSRRIAPTSDSEEKSLDSGYAKQLDAPESDRRATVAMRMNHGHEESGFGLCVRLFRRILRTILPETTPSGPASILRISVKPSIATTNLRLAEEDQPLPEGNDDEISSPADADEITNADLTHSGLHEAKAMDEAKALKDLLEELMGEQISTSDGDGQILEYVESDTNFRFSTAAENVPSKDGLLMSNVAESVESRVPQLRPDSPDEPEFPSTSRRISWAAKDKVKYIKGLKKKQSSEETQHKEEQDVADCIRWCCFCFSFC